MKTLALILLLLFIIWPVPVDAQAKDIPDKNIIRDTIRIDGGRKEIILIRDRTKPMIDNTIPDNNEIIEREGYISAFSVMRLSYKKPPEFNKNKDYSECFDDYPKLKRILSCKSNQLVSSDEQCIVFIHLIPPYKNVKISHLTQIRAKIIYSLGYDYTYFLNYGYTYRRNRVNWQQYLNYYPQEKAKSIFNADTVVRYSMNLEPEDYYKGKYEYLESLVIQKENKGLVEIFCFYSQKARKNLPYYWKQIEGIFRYDD
jgi:hypothetical protein